MFISSGILRLDLEQEEEKRVYHLLQYYFFPTLLSPVLTAIYFWNSGHDPGEESSVFLLVSGQLVLGTFVLMSLIDLVDHWGLGKGLHWFLAVSLSTVLFWQLFSFESHPTASDGYIGVIPDLIHSIFQGEPRLQQEFPNPGWVLLVLIGMGLATLAAGSVFELPLSHSHVRGELGRYPIDFLYSGYTPAFLAWTLMVGVLLVGEIPLSPWDSLENVLAPPGAYNSSLDVMAAGIYFAFSLALCTAFAAMVVMSTRTGARSLAKKVQAEGIRIPGFRRNSRAMGKVLERYLPRMVKFSGLMVGFFGFGNLFGDPAAGALALILVCSLHILYQDLRKVKEFRQPILQWFFGENGGQLGELKRAQERYMDLGPTAKSSLFFGLGFVLLFGFTFLDRLPGLVYSLGTLLLLGLALVSFSILLCQHFRSQTAGVLLSACLAVSYLWASLESFLTLLLLTISVFIYLVAGERLHRGRNISKREQEKERKVEEDFPFLLHSIKEGRRRQQEERWQAPESTEPFRFLLQGLLVRVSSRESKNPVLRHLFESLSHARRTVRLPKPEEFDRLFSRVFLAALLLGLPGFFLRFLAIRLDDEFYLVYMNSGILLCLLAAVIYISRVQGRQKAKLPEQRDDTGGS